MDGRTLSEFTSPGHLTDQRPNVSRRGWPSPVPRPSRLGRLRWKVSRIGPEIGGRRNFDSVFCLHQQRSCESFHPFPSNTYKQTSTLLLLFLCIFSPSSSFLSHDILRPLLSLFLPHFSPSASPLHCRLSFRRLAPSEKGVSD